MRLTFHLNELRAGVTRRLPGYIEECLKRGKMDESRQTLTFTERDFLEIRKKFNPKTGTAKIIPACC